VHELGAQILRQPLEGVGPAQTCGINLNPAWTGQLAKSKNLKNQTSKLKQDRILKIQVLRLRSAAKRLSSTNDHQADGIVL
jgi:hypothetical protein